MDFFGVQSVDTASLTLSTLWHALEWVSVLLRSLRWLSGLHRGRLLSCSTSVAPTHKGATCGEYIVLVWVSIFKIILVNEYDPTLFEYQSGLGPEVISGYTPEVYPSTLVASTHVCWIINLILIFSFWKIEYFWRFKYFPLQKNF
jgi:hypothetical protein